MESQGDPNQISSAGEEQTDEEREQQAQEQIERNEEEGQPQFPGDTGVAPDQADSGDDEAAEDEEEEAQEK